jgi:hypothetical protein
MSDKVELDANIDPELNKQFRAIIFKKYGYKRGAISDATEEAIRDYVTKYNHVMS